MHAAKKTLAELRVFVNLEHLNWPEETGKTRCFVSRTPSLKFEFTRAD